MDGRSTRPSETRARSAHALRSRSALAITDAELRLIARAAIMGDSSHR